MKAMLQFKKFKVLEMQYKSTFAADFEEEISPDFAIQVSLNEENMKQAIVRLEVEIGEDNQKTDYLKVIIAGFFTFDAEEEVSEEVIYQYYEINGTAILFPYLRSIVSDLTSKGDSSPIILPTLNIPAMIKARDEETGE